MKRTPHDPYHTQAARIDRFSGIWIGVVALTLFGLLGHVVYLKLNPDPRLEAAAGRPYSSRAEMARRGDVLDREGRILATSTVGYRLFIDPQEVSDLNTIALDLADLIGGDPVEYDMEILQRRDRRYVVIRHLLDDWQVEAVRRTPLRGVGLEPRLVRHYPQPVGEHIVGRVGFEHAGLSGMEHRFEERLAADDGSLTFLRDAKGQALWIEPTGHRERSDGESLRISIDLVVQEIADRHLGNVVEQYNAGGGRLIVLDSVTGEVLAMSDVVRSQRWKEYVNDPFREMHPSLGRNRCATDPYEPGSTFKPFIWAYATQLGKAKTSETLQTGHGPYVTGRRTIRDVRYYGPMTWEEVLIRSSNAGMAIVGERMSPRQLQDAVRAFGFGASTGSGIPGESRGLVTQPRHWTRYSQGSVPMGQEIAVTALQMVQAFSVFCRDDGTMPALRLTAVRDRANPVEIVHRVIDPEIARITRETMHKVMLEGTGRRANSDYYKIFGKSGTAQLPREGGGGYHNDRYISSFIAGAPLSDPRIVVLVIIDDPDRAIGHLGGAVAGPVARDVVDEVLTYLGVEPDADELPEPALVLR